MDRCANCNAPMPEDPDTCPYCRAPRGAGGLARSDGQGGSARAFEDGLARLMTESYLAKDIPLDDAGRGSQLDEGAGFLALSELRTAMARVEDADEPKLADLEAALTKDLPTVAIEGIQLSRLVDRSG